jgi:hypothetical protein
MSEYYLVMRKLFDQGLGNILKGYVSALSLCDDAFIEDNTIYMLGEYSSILDEKHIFKGQAEKPIETFYTWRLSLLKSEDEIQEHIENEYSIHFYPPGIGNQKLNKYYSSIKTIDLCYDPEKIHPIVRERILNNFNKLKFKPLITDLVEKIHTIFKDDNSLGISIRTWKATHENNIHREYSVEIYKKKIREVLNENKNINRIIISIDNEDFLEEYFEFFQELKIPCLVLDLALDLNKLQIGIIKVLTLSKCKYFLGNRISTFSELVFWFSKCQTKVYTVY